MATVIINIVFIIETWNRLQQESVANIDGKTLNFFLRIFKFFFCSLDKDGHIINSLLSDSHSNDFNNNNQRIIKLDILSSQNRAMVTVDGTIVSIMISYFDSKNYFFICFH